MVWFDDGVDDSQMRTSDPDYLAPEYVRDAKNFGLPRFNPNNTDIRKRRNFNKSVSHSFNVDSSGKKIVDDDAAEPVVDNITVVKYYNV